MNTLHRRDITAGDFRLLAAFCAALNVLEDEMGGSIYWTLGVVTLILPVWFLSGNGWQLSRYKPFDRQALWIETRQFRRVCNYINAGESAVVGLLYRMSILGVIADQKLLDRPRFRQPTWRNTPDGWKQDVGGELGFLLEARRALGEFRKGEAASE